MKAEVKAYLKTLALFELAKRDFYTYCQLMAPDFYTDNRQHLKDMCNALQEFYQSKEKVLIINLPPRHGKSRSASKFVEWILGNNPTEKIMTGSYNEMLSTNFAKSVRGTIQEVKADESRIVYNDIFPKIRIKRGDGAMNLWSLEGGYNNYLATSPTGTATGFGASILIIDDIIKNAEEAYNENTKAKHWDWFTNTMLSRLEEGGKIIIIMTRWASDDLAGRAMEHFKNAKVITMKALQDDGTMLCDDILSRESYQEKIRAMGEHIATANYQQAPIDLVGRLYSKFKTYTDIPRDDKGNELFTKYGAYTDTADTGADYLCHICYGVYNNQAYVLDVVYTKEPMEKTEPMVAESIIRNKIKVADIESNNGGRGFARNIERILKERNYRHCTVNSFHQGKNKASRILANSVNVMENIIFPANWRDKFPEYYNAMYKYQKEGKNAHDDAPDATTGVYERIEVRNIFSFE